MLLMDIPPHLHERVVCSISAAVKYQIPANIVLAVAEKEAGKPGQWVRNTNGTHDVGPMQFNTAYLTELAKYGIRPADVAQSGCYAYELAAWRLRGHLLKDQGDMWTKAANYHSRTPKYNAVYRADLINRAGKWAAWMEKNLVTQDVMADAQRLLPQKTGSGAIPADQEMANAAGGRSRQMTSPVVANGGYIPRQLLQID
jgi:hypothetical protein